MDASKITDEKMRQMVREIAGFMAENGVGFWEVLEACTAEMLVRQADAVVV